MPTYQNKNGDSGVSSYEISDTEIHVRFKDGSAYVYSYSRPGEAHVEHMKQLALQGSGLNSYINKYVGKNYLRKY